jgi:hypothetical protein
MPETLKRWKCDKLREDGCLDLVEELPGANGGVIRFMKWCPRLCGDNKVYGYSCPKERSGA